MPDPIAKPIQSNVDVRSASDLRSPERIDVGSPISVDLATPDPTARQVDPPSPVESPIKSPKTASASKTLAKDPVKGEKPTGIDPFFVTMIIAIVVATVIIAMAVKQLAKKRRMAIKPMNPGLSRILALKQNVERELFKDGDGGNIHAIGVGSFGKNEGYNVQVFVEDASKPLLEDPPTQLLPEQFRNEPIVMIEMPRATALAPAAPALDPKLNHRPLLAGTSVGNSSLTSQFGSIGYFCKPRLLQKAKRLFINSPRFLLSNCHVIANIAIADTCKYRDVLQRAAGDNGTTDDKVATLSNHVPIDFSLDKSKPNFVDAAIATIIGDIAKSPTIPAIGKITGQINNADTVHEMRCTKFGRSTGVTSGRVFSIHLSIYVHYAIKAQKAFFSEQILIVPDSGKFCEKGDSGSLVVGFAGDERRALGLLFAGVGDADLPKTESAPAIAHQKIEQYGVANPIEAVLDALKVSLDI